MGFVDVIMSIYNLPYGIFISFAITLCLFWTIRIAYLIVKNFTSQCYIERKAEVRTILVMGSGGHTAELIRLFKCLNSDKYTPRLYIIANNDISSEMKIHKLEQSLSNNNYTIEKIPRSRNVNQSYFTSILSTLHALFVSFKVVLYFNPDVIFCNGPGTCVPICIISFLLRSLYITDSRIIFVESICRVRTLSLTGNILQYIADIFVVQWPQLRDVCVRSIYFGRLT